MNNFRLWGPKRRKCFNSRKVTFLENATLSSTLERNLELQANNGVRIEVIEDMEALDTIPRSETQEQGLTHEVTDIEALDLHLVKNVEKIVPRPVLSFDHVNLIGYAVQVSNDLDNSKPKTYKDVIAILVAMKWK